jgi:polyhydroxyalkanoate synthesis regulator protein
MKTQVIITKYKNRKMYSSFHKKVVTKKDIIEYAEDDSFEIVIKDEQGTDITLITLKSLLPELAFSIDDVLDLIRRKGMGL